MWNALWQITRIYLYLLCIYHLTQHLYYILRVRNDTSYCAPYTGNVCKDYLGPGRWVLYQGNDSAAISDNTITKEEWLGMLWKEIESVSEFQQQPGKVRWFVQFLPSTFSNRTLLWHLSVELMKRVTWCGQSWRDENKARTVCLFRVFWGFF